MIGVISYRTGNARSVQRALAHLGRESRLVRTPDEAADADRLVLPGVGSAGVTMTSLREAGWLPFLADRVLAGGLPFLGVCVGVQVMFERSEEEGTTGLGWFSGQVRSFDRSRVRVPQMGWNRVRFTGDHPWVGGVADDHFYFVNSYRVEGADPQVVAGVTDYDGEFTSAVARDNLFGTQFHVEKSGPAGLALLDRFARAQVGAPC